MSSFNYWPHGTWRSRYRCEASCSLLPSRRSPGWVIGNGADSAAEMCRQGRIHKHGQCGRVHKCTPMSLWTHLLLMMPMVRQDTGPLQMPVDMYGISGGSENVCICTSLICSSGHQSWWPPWLRSCCVIREWLMNMHVNFYFPFKLGPKIGLCIIHEWDWVRVIIEFLWYA